MMRGERQGPRLCVPPSWLNAPPRCGQRREAGAQWWGPTRLHPGWVPEADGSVDPSTEGIHKDTDGPDQASDGVKYFAHLPGRFLVLVGFGVLASRSGHGPHLLPGCLLPRQGHRRVPGGGAGEGDTIVGGGGDAIGGLVMGLVGCVLHRWLPRAPWGAVGTQPKVLRATTSADGNRRCWERPSDLPRTSRRPVVHRSESRRSESRGAVRPVSPC